ncbi:MAG: hypothetical protein Q7R40_06425 [Phaeospirillum sp.]|nr:hypothetical protein [Phaeospirillum sp.]
MRDAHSLKSVLSVLLAASGSLLLSGCQTMNEMKATVNQAASGSPKCKVIDPGISIEYSGGCAKGLANGQGFARGRYEYRGDFVDGKKHGIGTYIWADDEKYVGEWRNDKREGNGTLSLNGVVYVGTFVNDEKSGGLGTLTTPRNKYNSSKNSNKGRWVGNNYIEQGEFSREKLYMAAIADPSTGCAVVLPNSQADESIAWNGGCREGFVEGSGVLTRYNAGKQVMERYEGSFQGGRPHGDGVFAPANGDRYEGTFKIGKMNGKGTYTWANGDRYEGTFNNGPGNGTGTFVWANSNSLGLRKYIGEFANSKPHGSGTGEFLDGDRYEGLWDSGVPLGETARHQSTAKEREQAETILSKAVADDATNWAFNTYDSGSLTFAKVKSRHADNSMAVVRAYYTFNHGRKGWVEGTFYAGGGLQCITFHDKADTCRSARTSTAEIAASRSGDFELLAGTPKSANGETTWQASCKDGGYAWVTQKGGSNVYSWGSGGFSASTAGADYTLTREQMFRKACKGG